MSSRFDYVIVGGGLQGALVALALLEHQPGARFALIERAERLGGNHLWSFHAGDVPEEARRFVDPLVAHRWPGYIVRFPGLERTLDEPYASIPSDHLDTVVRARMEACRDATLLAGVAVSRLGARGVVLSDGREIAGDVIIDARGPDPAAYTAGAGYQKFVGVEVTVPAMAPATLPVVMDATVEQDDGFRFLYTLPLAADRLLVEDTMFSDGPALDVERVGGRARAAARGLGATGEVRVETGVLPMPWTAGPRPRLESPLVAGYRGGWFHPVTGYSLPAAVRLAVHIATRPPGRALGPELAALADEHERQLRTLRFLVWLLFRAYPPAARRNVLARFYSLPVDTIRRFYAMQLTKMDRTRILCGRPPPGLSLARLYRQMISEKR